MNAYITQKGRNYHELQKISNLPYAAGACTAGGNGVLLYDKREEDRRAKGWTACAGIYFRGKQDRCMSGNDTLYLKIDQNIVVTDRRVTLGDVAKMECTDQAALRQIKQKKLYSFRAEDDKKKKNTLVVFSVLKVIELIHEDYPNLDISNEGASDFIVEYVKSPEKPVWMNCLKTLILCILIFFGAAFTIMAFNNDVGVTDVFAKFYQQITGVESSGITELEICYSIGLAVGIIVFFNHVGHKKITHDPTPIQIEMRKYETDLDTAFINNAERRGHSVDVD